jgi:hypothetical protein
VSELERRLTALGGDLDWPQTPDLATSARARLEAAAEPAPGAANVAGEANAAGAARRHAPPRRRLLAPAGVRRSLVLALVALLVFAGGVLAAVPGVRDAVLDFFGLQGATVERRHELPPVPQLRPLKLGTHTTLAHARRSLGFEPLVPRAAGHLDAVFVKSGVPGGELSLTYRPRPGLPDARSTSLGLLVGEFRGDLLPEYMGKIASQATRIERLRVDGARAIWIEGAPHLFFYRPPDSDFAQSELRVAANVLLLERGNLLVRLEGAFSRERAVELARSLEPSG